MTLRQATIKLAYEVPELRKHLIPILKQALELEEQMFTHPETKNKVKFKSLPEEMQKRLREKHRQQEFKRNVAEKQPGTELQLKDVQKGDLISYHGRGFEPGESELSKGTVKGIKTTESGTWVELTNGEFVSEESFQDGEVFVPEAKSEKEVKEKAKAKREPEKKEPEKKDEGKKPEKKEHPPRNKGEVKKKHNLTKEDDDEVQAFSKTLGHHKKMTDAQLMQKFMQKAKPETKERMKNMTPAEFKIMMAAISDDEEGGGKKAMALREATIKLASEVPELRKHLIPILREAAAPTYKNYVEKKQQKGERPLSEEEWERKVLQTGQSGEELKKDKAEKEKTRQDQAKTYKKIHKRVLDVWKRSGLSGKEYDKLVATPAYRNLHKALNNAWWSTDEGQRTLQDRSRWSEHFWGDRKQKAKDIPPDIADQMGKAWKELLTEAKKFPSFKGLGKHTKSEETKAEEKDQKDKKEKSKAEMKKEYIEAIQKSDMSPEDKKKALEQAKKPNFDPEAALGAMGDEEEEGKTASLRSRCIRLAHEVPELRKHLIPILQKTAADKAKSEDGAKKLFDAYKEKHPGTKKQPRDFYEKPDKDEDEKKDDDDGDSGGTASQIKTFKKTFDPKDFRGTDGWIGDRFPDEAAEDVSQPGSADEAVKHWVKELGWNVKPEDAREYLLDAGLDDEDVEEMSDDTLNEYTFWLSASRQHEEDYEDERDGRKASGLRQATIKLAYEVPEMRKHLVPLLKKTAGCGDEMEAGREHGEPGKGYGMTGPDVRGKGDWTPKSKGKCYYQTGDEGDRCYVTQKGGPGGQTKPAPSTRTWKEYEEQRWGK